MRSVMTELKNHSRRLLVLGLVVVLAACGGGGGNTAPFGGTTSSGSSGSSGSSSSTTTPTATAAAIDVVAGATSLGTGPSDTVTITATVKTAGNAGIAGAPISFSTDSGSITGAPTVTDSTGKATATLSAGADKSNRNIKVTVTSGAVSASTIVPVASETPASIEVVASANRVGTGASAVTITAVVKTATNTTLANAPIRFSADTGSVTASSTQTDGNGAARASFSPGADKTNRLATIQVASGSVSGQIAIVIDGSTVTVAGPGTLRLADATQSTEYTFKATDSASNPIAGLSLNLSGTLANVPNGTSVTTDANGSAKYVYRPSVAGSDVLTVRGAGATASLPITVSGQDFSFTGPASGTTIAVDPAQAAGATVSVRYLVNGAAPANGQFRVRFTSTAGVFLPAAASSSGVDLVSGAASVTLASRFAGDSTVQATVFAPSSPTVSVAQATLPVRFVATVANSLVLQMSPSVIGPNNAGSSTQQSEARALVLDAAGNPVSDVPVNFSRIVDTSGGNLSAASALTDANGLARVQYVSGTQSTATDGVTLQATVASNPTVTGQARLTVNQNALFIALGTGNVISNVNETTYQKQWTAYVTDSTGAPVPNVNLSVSALPTFYLKGDLEFTGGSWQPRSTNIRCQSEDTLSTAPGAKNNGRIDPNEDINGNGRLEPGNVVTVNGASGSASLRTDATGFALLNLQYAESYAGWVVLDLKVTANVAGTEASNTVSYLIQGLASDYSNQNAPPAGRFSPFGLSLSCTSPN